MTAPDRSLFLAAALARCVAGSRSVGVGTNSPIPAAAALLAQRLSPNSMIVAILGSPRHSPFTDGGRELFDFAAQGRLDSFFLGGGQIDGAANINLVGIGDKMRFPGSYGSAYLASLVPNVVLFRKEHSPRVLVPKVDFISASGVGPAGTYRPGGPKHLVTGRAVFRFDAQVARFTLISVHPWESLNSIRAETSFTYDVASDLTVTPAPTAEETSLLRGEIARELATVYPRFVAASLRQTGENDA
jgi:glutaconate CoA-transferase subunit B